MKIVLAGPSADQLMAQAYPALATAGLDLAGVVDGAQELADTVAALGGDDVVAVVQVEMWPLPEEAVQALAALAPARVAVLLPVQWEGRREAFEALPNLAGGFSAPVSWPQVAAALWTATGTEAGRAEEGPGPPQGTGAALPRPAPGPAGRRAGGGRAVALWSGPAGGTGRTTLALALAVLAARRGADVALLALSEPALSAYLCLGRVPNVTAFFASGDLRSAQQEVAWEGHGPAVQVILGPARPQDGVVDREQVAALVGEARAAHELVVLDLPALTPGGSVWALEPLRHVSDVVLVATPGVAGVAAVVESLATLRDVGAGARLHLVVNRCRPGGLSTNELAGGVASLWGSCPEVVAEVGFVPGYGDRLDRGELPHEERLARAVAALAQTAAGLPGLEAEGRQREGAAEEAGSRGRRFIRLEVTD